MAIYFDDENRTIAREGIKSLQSLEDDAYLENEVRCIDKHGQSQWLVPVFVYFLVVMMVKWIQFLCF